MRKGKKSFVGYCVLYFSVYSCILLLSIILINIIVDTKLKHVAPSIDELFEYEEYLVQDKFSKIPLKKFSKSEIVVFDENNTIIFSTNNHSEFSINAKELNYINDYYSDYYYAVKEYAGTNGEKNILVTKNRFDEETKYEEIVDYALLDDKLNIIKGNLFPDRDKLSECELELINGFASNKSFIEKYSYETIDGKARTLVFLEHSIDTFTMEKKINHIYAMWLYIIPLIAILEFIITYLFFCKLKKMILPLKELMDNYENVALPKFDDENIPREFKGFFASFKNLLIKLNEEKTKTDAIYKEKQSIITNISHDLKTPLTVIKGYAKALKDDMVPENKKDKYIDAIYNKSEVATNIIDSLFEYTQMEHPDFKSNFERLDFNEFCREYLAIKYTDLELQGYNLELELLDKEYMKDFDPKLMIRLFDNLINNSIKHNDKGVTIYFKLKRKKDKLKLVIADNGRCIDKKLEKTLFTAFVTGDESRKNGNGTGLGLFIAKRVVDIHDGEIKLVTKPKSPYKFEIEITL